tara:strand:- start:2320 stop:2844 length:525 start_codon:yes stop_codon:yes gene_type:complete
VSADTIDRHHIELDAAALRSVFACFPTGVVALCAAESTPDGLLKAHGMIVSSFTSVSIQPPLVSVYILEKSTTWAELRKAGGIGVSVLSEEHSVVARQMAVKVANRFAGIDWRVRPSGAILLDGAAATFECSIELEQPVGDHVLVVLRVHDIQEDRTIAPLVFHHSRFTKLPSH